LGAAPIVTLLLAAETEAPPLLWFLMPSKRNIAIFRARAADKIVGDAEGTIQLLLLMNVVRRARPIRLARRFFGGRENDAFDFLGSSRDVHAGNQYR
jgi:hypothetical protein